MGFILFILPLLTLAAVNAECPWDEPGLLPWSGGAATWGSADAVPSAGDDVVIPANKRILLDVSPPALRSLTIEAGAALTWGDVDDVTLKSSYILVNGKFEIGSSSCRFQKKATIILAGKRGEIPTVSHFDSKFLGVNTNATLEFHGKEKVGWTKLIQTLPVGADTCGAVYNHQRSPFGKAGDNGLHCIVFNHDGTVFDFNTFAVTDPVEDFVNFIDALPDDVVVAIASKGDQDKPTKRSWELVYESLEKVGKLATGTSRLRNVNKQQTYAFIVDKGSQSEGIEDLGEYNIKLDHSKTKRVSVSTSDLVFNAYSYLKDKVRRVDFRVLTEEVGHPIIKLNKDLSSWEPGDRIVIMSTDWDWKQAEEFTLLPCPTCSSTEVKLDHEAEYMHYGKITFGVDERAEVALLSRNILVKGTLEDECYGIDQRDKKLCDFFKEDTFGGHFKILHGFKAAHIEGCEFTQLGQQQVIGTYPIHFHMCGDVDGAWVKSNSIHNCKSRFVTIHGTDGLQVIDNVGYKTLGHGFFLEDSVEQRNLLEGNLGSGVSHGSHLLSDMHKDFCPDGLKEFCNALSVFWLTHPNNKIRNNVAAGSDNTGFWYIAAQEPLSVSKHPHVKDPLPRMHAIYSKIDEFTNNVAHSCKNRGLRVDGRISNGEDKNGVFVPENGVFVSTSSLQAHVGQVKEGNLIASYMDGYTGYKNAQNVWTKSGKLMMEHFTLADAPQGISISRSQIDDGKNTRDDETWTALVDSLFVGETDNVGKVVEPYQRSLPPGGAEHSLQGFVYYQGPAYLRNAYFTNYEEQIWNGRFRPAGAISFRKSNTYPTTSQSHVFGITFGFCDKTEGNFVYNGKPPVKGWADFDGNRQAAFHDVDGSVTGQVDTHVVPSNRFFTTPCCSHRDNWNMDVCPHRYAKVQVDGDGGVMEKPKVKDYPMIFYRDDRPDDPFALHGDRRLSYLVIKGKSYTVQFNGTAPDETEIKTENMIPGDVIRIGICFPKNVDSFQVTQKIFEKEDMFSVTSIKDLDDDTTGKAWFWDSNSGLLFFKLMGFHDSMDGEVCPGNACPTVIIERTGGSSEMATCFDEAYTGVAPYKKPDTCSETIPERKACSSTPTIPRNIGMPVEPSIEDVPDFSATCPGPPNHPNRGFSEYEGCFVDTQTHDLPYARWLLGGSMTTEVCVERCYHRGYQYAGLQNGNLCYCGNYFGVFGEDAGGCTKKCTGDSNHICGGSLRNSVYSTGKPADLTLPTCGPEYEGVEINGKCFYLGKSDVDFVQGEKLCVGLGGHLAKIDSEDIMAKVERYVRPSRVDVWIGLSDFVTELVYRWMDGTRLGAYNNFKTSTGNGDFVYLELASIFQWQTTMLNKLKRPLCQFPGSVPTTSKCGTNNSGNRIGTSQDCYAIMADQVNFREAQYACWTRNGQLAPITIATTKDEIVQHIHLFGPSGVHDYWVQGKVKNVYTELRYSELYNKGEAGPNTLNIPVCLMEEVSASNPCSAGWKLFEGNCYLYSAYSPPTFTDAQNLCKQASGDLVTIHSAAEHQFVINMAKTYTGKNPTLLLGYKYVNGSYQWVDEKSTTVSYWKNRQGSTNLKKGECVKLRTSNSLWYNAKCSAPRAGVVCKLPAAS